VAGVYDLQHDAAHQDLLTMPSPTTGQPVSLSYLLPQSVDDLARQRRMYEFLVRRAGGVAGRLPQHLATVAIGLYDVRHLLGKADPAFAERVARYFEYCRENDYSIGTIFSDPLHHRHHTAAHHEPLHVVTQHADGIVVRGARGVGTQSPYANELLCMTSPRPDRPPEEIVYFGVPVNTEGIHVICRESYAPADPADHLMSAAWDEMDAIVVFHDVFIPWERVERVGVRRRLARMESMPYPLAAHHDVRDAQDGGNDVAGGRAAERHAGSAAEYERGADQDEIESRESAQ
jgi:4-hydroxyphenylacetate 3-monooxygenase